jgi:hypothetical protein
MVAIPAFVTISWVPIINLNNVTHASYRVPSIPLPFRQLAEISDQLHWLKADLVYSHAHHKVFRVSP